MVRVRETFRVTPVVTKIDTLLQVAGVFAAVAPLKFPRNINFLDVLKTIGKSLCVCELRMRS